MEQIIYQDDRFTLGKDKSGAYLIAGQKRYSLSCHPFEPCLYITDESGSESAVHNSFDPYAVMELFQCEKTVSSITGFEYDAKDFCKMVEYAAPLGNISIDDAEKAFGNRAKKKPQKNFKNADSDAAIDRTPDDPVYDVLAEYPECAVEYCIVKDDLPYYGYISHWRALVLACQKHFESDGEGEAWNYDFGKATAAQIESSELFAPSDKSKELNYRRAFLHPPYETSYTGADFDRVNAALFPAGTDALEVYKWSDDWSDYFDDGHEWWGALCLTVYDKRLDRFCIILASATD